MEEMFGRLRGQEISVLRAPSALPSCNKASLFEGQATFDFASGCGVSKSASTTRSRPPSETHALFGGGPIVLGNLMGLQAFSRRSHSCSSGRWSNKRRSRFTSKHEVQRCVAKIPWR